MSNAFNPIAPQGQLNRVATHIVVTEMPELNVNAGYMAKGQAVVTFEGDFTDIIANATGVTVSQIPFVMGQIEVNLLRSQPLANLWMTQAKQDTFLGDITAYSDSSTLDAMSLTNASIMGIVPGPLDGTDPTYRVTIRGTFYINNNMWLGIATV